MSDDVIVLRPDTGVCPTCGARLAQITPVENGRVVVEATLHQCPWCPTALPEIPAGTDEIRAAAVGVVGGVHGRGGGGFTGAAEDEAPASPVPGGAA